MPNPRVNLDHSATTPLLLEVQQVMAALDEGNPSSIHQAGQRAKRLLEQARKQIATLINAKPEEVYCTSCGTESNNWALRGLLAANKRKGLPAAPKDSATRAAQAGNHVIISAIEHPSVSLAARRLELDGAVQVSVLPVDRDGLVSPEALRKAIRPETVLVSVMLANGEVGTIEPIKELAAIAHEQGTLFHTDAIAAAGHIAVDVKALGVDALSLAANQFYGPQGAAALFVREGVRILPLLEGGGQERGGRSGTEALPPIVGMGVAAELAKRELAQRIEHLRGLRDRLHDGLKERIEGLRVNGPSDFRRVLSLRDPSRPRAAALSASFAPAAGGPRSAPPVESRDDALEYVRLPHNLHVCVDGVSSESLVLGLDQAGIAAGLGSACNSKAMRPSHVLKAMGLSDDESKGALVLTIGVQTTNEEIDQALEIIPTVVRQLRNITALTSRA